MDSKKKFFVNYYSGASGHFFGLILWILLTRERLALQDKRKALHESQLMNQYHTLTRFWDYGDNQQVFQKIDRGIISVEQAVEIIKSKLNFHHTPYDFYIGYTHVTNATPLMKAVDNSVLFNIVMTENDEDQVAWNWFTKTGQHNIQQLNTHLKTVKNGYNRLSDVEKITPESSRLLKWYVTKFAMSFGFQRFVQRPDVNWSPRYDIQFSDIMNGNLKTKINDLVNFLEVSVDTETINFLHNIIDEYVSVQTMPIQIDLEHFS